MSKHKNKRVEVLSAKMRYLKETSNEEKVNFGEVLTYMNGRKYYDEPKEYELELKLIETDIENCLIGIIITDQNKNLPPKRNRSTGVHSKLGLKEGEETLSFGNVFLYDTVLNVFLYEVNMSGCSIDKLIEFIQQEWARKRDGVKFDLSLHLISRKGEYERLLKMDHYTEILVELAQPTEILQDYKDDTSTMFSTIKRYLKDGLNTNSDTMTIKLSAHGVRTNKQGLDRKGLLKIVNSVRYLLKGSKKENVIKLAIKGYITDPNEPDTVRPINLVADTFNTFIKLPTVTQLANLQEIERKEEIERLYKKHLTELKNILKRDSNGSAN